MAQKESAEAAEAQAKAAEAEEALQKAMLAGVTYSCLFGRVLTGCTVQVMQRQSRLLRQ